MVFYTVLGIILTLIIAVVIVITIYQKLTHGICKHSTHMVGKVVLVTGGNSGIGFETAKDLAARGAKLILACRNIRAATDAREEIIKATGNTEVYVKQLDLESLQSVKDFCKDIINNEPHLDVLINNAGAVGLPNKKTADGLDAGLQANYFGPFLLTCLLLPLLKKSAPSRIINVSSLLHKYGKLDFNNLNMDKDWNAVLVYNNSKLYMNLMTVELSNRLKGTGVTVNALHPGISATNMTKNIPYAIVRAMITYVYDFMFQSSWEAAQTSIYLSVSPEVKNVSGKYFSDCREKMPSKISQDPELAKKLWTETEKLVNFTLPN